MLPARAYAFSFKERHITMTSIAAKGICKHPIISSDDDVGITDDVLCRLPSDIGAHAILCIKPHTKVSLTCQINVSACANGRYFSVSDRVGIK